MKVRNYSFQSSKRLPIDKMTEINGIKVPSMPGSCYHAIMCALAESKDQFIIWEKIIERAEKYMRQYGGDTSWEKFQNKSQVKTCQQRIKDNTHTLTRSGRDCYGYRLHECGMVIYFFKDGAVLFTGGEFKKLEEGYNVEFYDGKGLQVRYRGTTMTFKEYKRFLDAELIDASGRILNAEGIRELRTKSSAPVKSIPSLKSMPKPKRVQVSVILDEGYNQETAHRLENMGLVVTDSDDNEIGGTLPYDKVDDIINDTDVLDVIVD